MPRKTIKMNYYNQSGSKIYCNQCDYSSLSETGIKLHRKMKHGLTEKYGIAPITYLCGGCRNKKSHCTCSK